MQHSIFYSNGNSEMCVSGGKKCSFFTEDFVDVLNEWSFAMSFKGSWRPYREL